MKKILGMMCVGMVMAVGAAETTGNMNISEVTSENTDFWNTTGRTGPAVSYARVAVAEQEGVTIAVTALMATDNFLSGGDFDALIYYPYVVSSPFLASTFPMGMRIIIK